MSVSILVAIAALVAQSQFAHASEPSVIGPTQVQEPAVPPQPKCQGLAGVWLGYADGPDYQGPMILHVGRTTREGRPPDPHNRASLPDDFTAHGLAAAMDAPAAKAFKMPLNGVLREGQRVTFALPGRGWQYAGTLSADGSTISGSWTGMGGLYSFDRRGFSLTRWKQGDPSVPTEFKCMSRAVSSAATQLN
jgi:hypothetical protein